MTKHALHMLGVSFPVVSTSGSDLQPCNEVKLTVGHSLAHLHRRESLSPGLSSNWSGWFHPLEARTLCPGSRYCLRGSFHFHPGMLCPLGLLLELGDKPERGT